MTKLKINSINKNEIPLILEDFSDEDSKLLTLKVGSLNAKNWNECYNNLFFCIFFV